MTQQPEQIPHHEALTKRERKLQRRQERETSEHRTRRRQTIKRVIKWSAGLLICAGAVILIVKAIQSVPKTSPEDVISKSGLHWHAKLKIVINDKEEPIPAGIGIGAVHNPVHTHELDNTIHLEFQGRVTKDDLRLSEFFKIWNKEFNTNCILDSCNGPEGTVKMLVNGQPNLEFEQYQMKDKDEIEIRYE